MRKLLIALQSDLLADTLREILQEQWEITVCMDGISAAEALSSFQPEALIIDLKLPRKAGLAVLSEAFPDLPPVIIALGSFISPYMERAAMSLGVGYIMQLPCDVKNVVDCLADMYEAYMRPPTKTTRHLRALNFDTKVDGYRFLAAGVPRFSQDRTQPMEKELYAYIADTCGARNAKCVERSIRSAIQIAWEHRDIQKWSYYFPLNSTGDVECPSNKQLISRLAEIV